MKFHNLEQGSAEWHEFRRTHIGASEAPAIMGKSSWATASDILEQKISGVIEAPNYAMKRGTALEPKIRAMAEEQLGKKFTPCVITSDQFPWMSASLDGLSEAQDEIIEVKCGSESQFHNAKKGVVPEHYEIQMQHQMFVSGVSHCWFVTYWDEEIATVKVQRWETQRMLDLVEAIANFHRRLASKMKDFKPATFASAPEDISFVSFRHERGSRILAEMLEICEREKEDKARKDLLKAELYEIAPQQNFVLDGIKFVRSQRSSYDYKAMEADGIDLEKYKKAGEPFWTIKTK